MKRNRTAALQDNTLPRPGYLQGWWVWIALAVILAFTASIRLRLLEMPLERDEGEYAYMGQLMLQGVPPYQAAYNMKFPGTYAAYALIMAVFGQTIAGIHLGVLLVNAVSILLIFVIARRIWDAPAGLMAAAAFALFTMGRGTLGLAGHATHFVVLPMLGALLLMLKASEKPQQRMHFAAGALLGLAVLMKQPAALYIPFFAIFPLWDELRQRPIPWREIVARLLSLALGIAFILLITAAILWQAGVFGRFWFWTVDYARTYASQVPTQYILHMLLENFPLVTAKTWSLWLLACAGLVLLCLRRDDRRSLFFIITFTVFSFLAVCPTFIFRQHYFIPMLPAVGMLIGGGLSFATQWLRQRSGLKASALPAIVFLAAWGFSFYSESNLFLRLDAQMASRHIYGMNPFVESQAVAEYIRDHTESDDTIAVFGSEPQICFYANRRSATGYIYMYPLMEGNPYSLKMQQEMAHQIETARPKYVVFVNIFVSWLTKPTSPTYIFDWCDRYIGKRKPVAIVEFDQESVRYKWDEDVGDGEPATEANILIFKLR